MIEGIYKLDEIPQQELIDTLTIVKRQKGRKKKKENLLLDIVTAFDIETTKVMITNSDGFGHPYSFMYIWQFQLGSKYTIIGRTWDEFTELQKWLWQISDGVKNRLKLSSHPVFCCYIHNLAYEWQYLQGVYDFQNEDIFFRDVRKPIYCKLNNILELRCSYLHSNMSLSKFGDAVGATTPKLDGRLFDYSKIRYPWTTLSAYELHYCVNDVRTLEESLRLEMERDGDTLLTIPLTATGYIRRELKAALKPLYYTIKQLLPDWETYQQLRRCFRGGDTHANRFRVGHIIENMESYDRESSYPDILLNYDFPMGPWRKVADADNTLDRVLRFVKAGNAVIGDYHFKGLDLINHKEAFPYLPIAKCKVCENVVEDNGRIIHADLCIVSLTEIDLEIVLKQYKFHTIAVYNVKTAMKAPLPKAYREVIQKYYEKKTLLKGQKGQEYYYIKSKNILNAGYGCAAQQTVHPIIEYKPEGVETFEGFLTQYVKHMPDEEQAEKELQSAPFPYTWGVYTTAYARMELFKAVRLAGVDKNGISNVVYVDTDSIKTICIVDIDKLNTVIQARSAKNGATAYDSEGNKHYIGMWDHEYSYIKFITQGAKRYAYIKLDDEGNPKLGVTVSGVTHKEHIYYNDDGSIDHKTEYAVEELQSLENFKEGMTWEEAGGTASVYMDAEDCKDDKGGWIKYTDPETGKSIEITPCVSIVNSTYTMTIDKDYKTLIDDLMKFEKFCIETGRIEK